MRKRIPIARLTVGMNVAGLDRSWLSTPFFRHRLNIRRPEQIETLKRAGIRFVDIEIDGDPQALSTESIPGRTDDPPIQETPVPVEDPPSDERVSFDEELRVARQVYHQAKLVVEQAMQDTRIGRAIDTDAVSRVVQSQIDSLLRNSDALVSLSRLKSFDEYTFFHSVNTSVLALALGRKLKMARDVLHLLGMGTLLHDIGKTKVPLEILNKPGRFEPHEFEIMKQHALRGAEILSRTPGFREEIIRPALEHHERVNGTGYPFGRTKQELTQLGLISSVVDIYDAMTSDRCYHKAMPAHQALQFLYELGQRGHLDSALVQHFIQCVGVYPVGSCVALNTGEIAVIKQIHPSQPVNPFLLLVRDAGRRPITPEPCDLSEQTGRPHRKIVAVLNHADLGVDPALYLDTEANETAAGSR